MFCFIFYLLMRVNGFVDPIDKHNNIYLLTYIIQNFLYAFAVAMRGGGRRLERV